MAARARLLVGAALLLAQNPPPQPTFKTDINYVRVDAYPTHDGQPVLDLRQEDFEILEDGVPQKIDAFEHVVVRPAGPQETRREPNTVAESRAALENPRARVFVVFLDFHHVDVSASHNIRKPLIDTLNRLIGQDDLVGVMTPEMSGSDISFARRMTTIEGMLTKYWTWGERDSMINADPIDQQYALCYPNPDSMCRHCCDQGGIALEMIDRRRERRTLDALEDLVQFLRAVREERKAVLTITNGWRLYRPDERLARELECHSMRPEIFVDPRTGKLTTKNDPAAAGTSDYRCEADRRQLAQLDDETEFRRILDEANRANTSFYPIDPRGLPVFDEPMMRMNALGPPPAVVPPSVDAARLTARLTSLRTLADATDGLAIVDTNDLDRGLKRVVDDLTSYYLLGYYSSGKLDGRFHKITVRVKRPGVQVRARRGYLSATASEVSARSAPPVDPAADAEARAIDAVVAPLGGLTRDLPVRLQIATGWKPDRTATVWAVCEFAGGDDWRAGGEADVMLTAATGPTLATAHAPIAAGSRSVRVALTPAGPLAPGEYVVRVRARGAGPGAIPVTEAAHLRIPAPPQTTGAILIRRGPATANKEVPTADVRFRRSEQLRVEIAAAESGAASARLLDRTGKPLAVPVVTAVRDDADGSRWLTAQLTLAPLAPGDYVLEVSRGDRTLVAFRVIP